MTHKIKLAPSRYTGLKPRTVDDGRLLVKAAVTAIVLIILVVGGVYLSQSIGQRSREAHWQSAKGVMEQVRPVLVGQWQGKFGGWMLYDAQVLVTYKDAQGIQKRWVTLRQTPKSLSQINFDASHWIGRSCIVRWNPANSNEIDVEIS